MRVGFCPVHSVSERCWKRVLNRKQRLTICLGLTAHGHLLNEVSSKPVSGVVEYLSMWCRQIDQRKRRPSRISRQSSIWTVKVQPLTKDRGRVYGTRPAETRSSWITRQSGVQTAKVQPLTKGRGVVCEKGIEKCTEEEDAVAAIYHRRGRLTDYRYSGFDGDTGGCRWVEDGGS